MDAENVAPFQKVNHCKLIWLFDNVYQCGSLLKTCIDGPDYGTKCALPFPWVLRLGQSTNHERRGISLFIQGMNLPKGILVNFRVCVRRKSSLIPLLDEKYQAVFEDGSIWESPLLVTNEDFKKEPSKKILDFWDMCVELMWNEKVAPEIRTKKDSYDAVSKLLSFKELGVDLKQFFRNGRFSDIYIRCEDEEIPSHKAILGTRCPYFAQKINSYSGRDWDGINSGLSPTKDINVMNAFLLYLYTGDIESLMGNGPLPVGIHKCAQRMGKYDLEWLTSPLQLSGYSTIRSKIIQHEWIIDNFSERIKEEGEYRTISSECFGNDQALFALHVKPCISNNSVQSISVSLQLDKLEKGDDIYVSFDLSVKTGEKHLVSKKIVNDLKLKSSLEFPDILSIQDFLEKPEASFICQIFCFGDDLSTHIDKISLNCGIMSDKKTKGTSPVSELGDGCHGWISLSWDLGQLLMTANHSDCTIVVGDDRLPAHRVILAARSPYFAAVFNEKEEGCTGSSKEMEIFVEKDLKICSAMMKIIMEEIYTGYCEIKDSQSAKNIHNFAKFFGLRRLAIKCLKFPESE